MTTVLIIRDVGLVGFATWVVVVLIAGTHPTNDAMASPGTDPLKNTIHDIFHQH